MTREEMDFIGSMNMCDEISNEAYRKIMTHCEEQQPCEDCISRQALLEWIKGSLEQYAFTYSYDTMNTWMLFEEQITAMPSVTPQPITLEKAIDYLLEIGWMQEHDKEMAQPKVGEWLKNGELCKCSRCGSNVLFSAIKSYNYCYHCGARMEVSDAKR